MMSGSIRVCSEGTRNSMAQKFINQGINLLYAFNHSEAFRAFQEAARLDSKLAMAYWGQALVLGPNINAMMNPNVEHRALLMIEQAKSYIADVSQREQALINALGSDIQVRAIIGSRMIRLMLMQCRRCTNVFLMTLILLCFMLRR